MKLKKTNSPSINSIFLSGIATKELACQVKRAAFNSKALRMFLGFFLFFNISVGAYAQNQGYLYVEGTGASDKFKDVIKSTDPSVFSNAAYINVKKAKMWDRDANNNQGAWIEPDSWIFKLNYQDGITAEIRIRKNDFDQAAAVGLAEKFGKMMGQLPANLREGVDYINILKSDALWGGNNFERSIEITIGKTSKDYEASGNMEEILFHEATHATLDDQYSKGWKESRNKDSKFASKYSFDNPDREDISESFLLYAALNYRSNRIAEKEIEKIKQQIPNRINYYKNLNLNIHPWQNKVEDTVISGDALFDSNRYYRLTTEYLGKNKSLDVANDDGNAVFLGDTGNYSGQSWRIEKLDNGYYRLTTEFRGQNMSLDIVNDDQDNKLFLAKTGNQSGQFWKIEKLASGYFRLTNAFQGEGKSLDVVNDGTNSRVQLAPTGNYSGQNWLITEIK